MAAVQRRRPWALTMQDVFTLIEANAGLSAPALFVAVALVIRVGAVKRVLNRRRDKNDKG